MVTKASISKVALFSLLLFLNFNCERLSVRKDDELSLERQDYTGTQLRIDGYYYLEYFNPEKHMSAFVLFQNGVLTYFAAGFDTFDQIENNLIDESLIQNLKGLKSRWGVYQINNDSIKIERWYGGQGALPVYLSKGTILNDTTFNIKEVYYSDGSKKRDTDDLYHFRQFSPKPDSTNSYIK